MFRTFEIQVGALYRRKVRARLESLRLPYTENSTLFESHFTAMARNEDELLSLNLFRNYCVALMTALAEADREDREARRQEQRKEQQKKLARKNRFRRLTFRKPLPSL